MNLTEGANVLTQNGDKIGELDRVVIDPRDGSVTHLVIRKGFLLPVDKVLPIDMVSFSERDEIHLKGEVEKLSDLPDFAETNYVPVDEESLSDADAAARRARPVYWYPVVGATPLLWNGGIWGTIPPTGMFPYPMEIHEERNVPEGTVALKEGAKVLSKDDQHLGDVQRVLTENRKDQITHLVITKGTLNKQKRLIPASWISRIKDDAVQLSVSAKFVEKLQDYED